MRRSLLSLPLLVLVAACSRTPAVDQTQTTGAPIPRGPISPAAPKANDTNGDITPTGTLDNAANPGAFGTGTNAASPNASPNGPYGNGIDTTNNDVPGGNYGGLAKADGGITRP